MLNGISISPPVWLRLRGGSWGPNRAGPAGGEAAGQFPPQGSRALTGAGMARWRGQPCAHGFDVIGRRGAAHAGAALPGARPGQAAAGARRVGVEAVSPGRRVRLGRTGRRGAGAYQRTPLLRRPQPRHVVVHGRHLVQGQRLAARRRRRCQVHVHHHSPRGARTARPALPRGGVPSGQGQQRRQLQAEGLGSTCGERGEACDHRQESSPQQGSLGAGAPATDQREGGGGVGEGALAAGTPSPQLRVYRTQVSKDLQNTISSETLTIINCHFLSLTGHGGLNINYAQLLQPGRWVSYPQFRLKLGDVLEVTW